MDKLFEIIHEDEWLLVINKPAGLVCHPTKTDQYSSLISRARLYLGEGSHPQLINRLDRETSGVTLIAKDEVTARELRKLWENRLVRKEYLALVHGEVRQTHSVIDCPLGQDVGSKVAIKDSVRWDGAPARTEYWVKKRLQKKTPKCNSGLTRLFTLLSVVPLTGRKHQIRIHLAHIGHPLVGDKLYGEDEDLYLALVEDRLTPADWQRLTLPYHALHAGRVSFSWRGQEQVFQAEPEEWFLNFVGVEASEQA